MRCKAEMEADQGSVIAGHAELYQKCQPPGDGPRWLTGLFVFAALDRLARARGEHQPKPLGLIGWRTMGEMPHCCWTPPPFTVERAVRFR
jgi:hypothetical protein